MSLIGIWIYDVETGKELALLPMKLDPVRWRLAFKPKSTILVCGDINGAIHFWDIKTRKLIKKYTGHEYRITCISFNSEGTLLASGSGDETVRLWDTNTGQYNTINVGNRPDTVLFSPDGTTLATSGSKGIMLWNTNTGELKHRLDNTENIFRLDFSPDDKILASSRGKDTLFWNTETGKISKKFKDTSKGTILAFSPDGKRFATVAKNYCTVQLWDVHTGKLNNTFEGTPVYGDVVYINEDGKEEKVKENANIVNTFKFSPDGNTLAVSYLNEEIVLWNVFTGQRQATLEGLRNVHHLLFSPDGNTLVSRNSSDIFLSDINTKDIKKSELNHVIREHHSEVNTIAFSPDGQTLASGHEWSLQLWALGTGKQKQSDSKTLYNSTIQSLAYSPDGKMLAGFNPHASLHIMLWDTSIGEQITSLDGLGKNSRDGNSTYHAGKIAFSPDGRFFANSSLDNIVRLWDVKRLTSKSSIGRFRRDVFGNKMVEFKGHNDKIKAIAFSPNGNILASGSDDNTIRLWDVHKREPKTILKYTDDKGTPTNLISLKFSPDGKILASGNYHEIDLWDAVTTEHKGKFIHDNPLGPTYLAFSPDSQTLAGGVSKRIMLWDMRTLQSKSTFLLNEVSGYVCSIVFSPDGKTLASGSSDGTVLIWDVTQ